MDAERNARLASEIPRPAFLETVRVSRFRRVSIGIGSPASSKARLPELEGGENEVSAASYIDLWQKADFVAEGRICLQQPIILGDCLGKTVPPFRVSLIDFRPRWGEEHVPVVTVGVTQCIEDRLAGPML